jgi:hypothetical protein
MRTATLLDLLHRIPPPKESMKEVLRESPLEKSILLLPETATVLE